MNGITGHTVTLGLHGIGKIIIVLWAGLEKVSISLFSPMIPSC